MCPKSQILISLRLAHCKNSVKTFFLNSVKILLMFVNRLCPRVAKHGEPSTLWPWFPLCLCLGITKTAAAIPFSILFYNYSCYSISTQRQSSLLRSSEMPCHFNFLNWDNDNKWKYKQITKPKFESLFYIFSSTLLFSETRNLNTKKESVSFSNLRY